jgi:hypothetical protein
MSVNQRHALPTTTQVMTYGSRAGALQRLTAMAELRQLQSNNLTLVAQ